ncbi:NAD(P)-dependent oxidoreductase [Oceanibacterium hippocampi]|uniref:3-hydroxyisobutyrate dehydrogenase n=1 Tax=Oceanibacterium hippocampi TaxID=745714 RepID=A0A1Y5TUF0_9PROT|nr:NAD(P)-dependent oxidoreductase [Oceanibacterium hippocampi]SLN72034.1 3-hydroxyisobutyrate dehydrogenase [Oceanibacterium hippocampi]
MKIGFVGVGLMGLPMAHRLIDAGHELHVFSTNAGALAELAAKGALPAESLIDVARRVEVFCACRVTPEQSREVFIGAEGVIALENPPPLCIDFATIEPLVSREIGARLADAGIAYLDAPISGGPTAAREGTLSVIVGGEAGAVECARPIFDAFGKRTFHMGGPGTGVTAKLCNNMISITTHALVAEAMVLGVKAGIDAEALYDVMRNSSASSQTLNRVVPNHFLPRDFKAAATLEMIMKDLQGAISLARAEGVRLLLPNVAMQCFVDAAGRGHLHDDIASVILPMEEIAGVTVGSA